MSGETPGAPPQRTVDQDQPPIPAQCFNVLLQKEAVMRRPFLVPLSIAVILVVILLGFEAASRPWGMMGPAGPWGYGPPMMHGYMMRGSGPPPWSSARDLNLSVDAVKAEAERWVAWQGNPRLKLGDVKEKDADTITADIVTKDNSLVERLAVDRHSGAIQDVED
jgi:hypothetical protein